jgi:hypothetical protein
MSNQKHQNKNITLLSQLTCTKKVQYVRYQIIKTQFLAPPLKIYKGIKIIITKKKS